MSSEAREAPGPCTQAQFNITRLACSFGVGSWNREARMGPTVSLSESRNPTRRRGVRTYCSAPFVYRATPRLMIHVRPAQRFPDAVCTLARRLVRGRRLAKCMLLTTRHPPRRVIVIKLMRLRNFSRRVSAKPCHARCLWMCLANESCPRALHARRPDMNKRCTRNNTGFKNCYSGVTRVLSGARTSITGYEHRFQRISLAPVVAPHVAAFGVTRLQMSRHGHILCVRNFAFFLFLIFAPRIVDDCIDNNSDNVSSATTKTERSSRYQTPDIARIPRHFVSHWDIGTVCV